MNCRIECGGWFFVKETNSVVFEINGLDVRFRRVPMCARSRLHQIMSQEQDTQNVITYIMKRAHYVRGTCACKAHVVQSARHTCAPVHITRTKIVCSTPSGLCRGTSVVQRFWRSIGVYPLVVGCLLRTVCIVMLFCCPAARVAFFT